MGHPLTWATRLLGKKKDGWVAKSYKGIECMFPTLPFTAGSLFPVVQISKVSIFPSYGLGCHNKPVCSFLRDGSRDPESFHFGKQCGSFQSEFRGCAARSTNDPADLLQRFHNQSAIRVFQGHR